LNFEQIKTKIKTKTLPANVTLMADENNACFSKNEVFFSEHNFNTEVLKPKPEITTAIAAKD